MRTNDWLSKPHNNPTPTPASPTLAIHIRGARQHNLRDVNVDIPHGALTVVTGVSGAGKSSLVLDTLYAEGQRRYVETFSAYARQFLDRMPRAAVDAVEGVPAAVAIAGKNTVRNSRSTVGTMTELNDHIKLLFAHAAQLFDAQTGEAVRAHTPQSIWADVCERAAALGDPRLAITFAVQVPALSSAEDVQQWLAAGGFTKVIEREQPSGDAAVQTLDVVADRFRASRTEQDRALQAIELALSRGAGHMRVYVLTTDADGQGAPPALLAAYSTQLHCAGSGRSYTAAHAGLFSFNSASGACPTCRGFGRVMGVDYARVIPNAKLTLRTGAIAPLQTPAWAELQEDLLRFAQADGIPIDIAWSRLSAAQRDWVIKGAPQFKGNWTRAWAGVERFFEYLQSKSYKMHIRVLLARYRSYTTCPDCAGARLQPESLLWRVGTKAMADAVLAPAQRFMPQGVSWSRAMLESLPGLCVHDLMRLPLNRLNAFCAALFEAQQDQHSGSECLPSVQTPDTSLGRFGIGCLSAPTPQQQALRLLAEQMRARLGYLLEVGLDYLHLDRPSRSLSGGEIQRIHLTGALGAALTRTLFVLDEPSTGLHPRDLQRITRAMHRLRDAGNTLVVVEHDPALMHAADHLIDMGPGAGVDGGRIVFEGTPAQLAQADTLTGAYLRGQRQAAQRRAQTVDARTPRLMLQGVRAHNLGADSPEGLSVSFPLQRLVVVTGVSGSGKSTLVGQVLRRALEAHFGQPLAADALRTDDGDSTEAASGEGNRSVGFEALHGAEALARACFIDQSPIGKTARSTPVSYVGAWDGVRTLFAASPAAQQAGCTAAHFSFNTGDGRCGTCGGSGFEHVEMQFLSDVYLPCPTCNGSRWAAHMLDIRMQTATGAMLNVAEVLELSAAQALVELAGTSKAHAHIQAALQALVDVGLGYVRLGQAVPTLSGGEAQRLKIAAHLAEVATQSLKSTKAAAAKTPKKHATQPPTLFVLDEPTTGLHFDDTACLMRALQGLLDAGHSLIVVEHNVDVMAAADWIIDLGPEGGAGGGRIVFEGTPQALRDHPRSHTAAALRQWDEQWSAQRAVPSDAPAQIPPALAAPTCPKTPQWHVRGLGRLDAIEVLGARENNLKNLSVRIPHGQFNVVTGVSGSGKSTLAFDIVFGEGQRRYLETLGAWARSIVGAPPRPQVQAVHGTAPSVAIEQRLSQGGMKSTVGTMTEIWHYLRLLFVKLGVQHCPKDGAAVQPQTPQHIAQQIAHDFGGRTLTLMAPLVMARKGIYTEVAEAARMRGVQHLRVDGAWVRTAAFPKLARYREHTIEEPVATLTLAAPATAHNMQTLGTAIDRALKAGDGVLHVIAGQVDELHEATPSDPRAKENPSGAEVAVFSTRHACPQCGTSYPELDPRLFSFNSPQGWCPDCVGTGLQLTRAQRQVYDDSPFGAATKDRESGREIGFEAPEADDLNPHAICPTCSGSRLNERARAVRFAGQSITTLAAWSVRELRLWAQEQARAYAHDAPPHDVRAATIARDVWSEILHRLRFLEEVGLGYLSLNRSAPTLSGGEAQRIRLAAQLGSQLHGACYVLDEPTIGLHARDNQRLIHTLRQLCARGNTLLVVEHDRETICAAEHIIDIGPGAGSLGGQLVAQGSVRDVMAAPHSVTGQCLTQAQAAPSAPQRPMLAADWVHSLTFTGARIHNLKGQTVRIPLGRLVAITGVSGSGKSTLAHEVLLRGVQAHLQGHGNSAPAPKTTQSPNRQNPDVGQGWLMSSLPFTVEGAAHIDRVLVVDQSPIGKTPRSCPATYVGFFDAIRKLFAATLQAQALGWGAGHFSFNTAGGRCPACEGQGVQTLSMSFLPDVKTPCPACSGTRYAAHTRAVLWRGKSIADVLAMTVDEAVEFFASTPSIASALQLLQAVGLGYLQLGQSSPTLSGGEAQRIKLVAELARAAAPMRGKAKAAAHTLYVLDEPTVGLHMRDVQRLTNVLHQLVDAGHSVVCIEHDTALIAQADWVIDMGPEGGADGGQVVGSAPPQEIARLDTHTGQALAEVFQQN